MTDKKPTDLTHEIISEIGNDDISFDSNDPDDTNENGSSGNDNDNGDSNVPAEKSINEIKISKEFQENVVKFVKLDDLMKKKQQEMTELREQKKPCEQFILKYLDDVNENVIEITDGKLRKNKSETKSAINQDIMKLAISEKIKDPQIVEDILKLMEEKRPMNSNVNLKRTGTRPDRKGKKIGKAVKNDKK